MTPARTITVTRYGWWRAARQRLIAHIGPGKCVDGGLWTQDDLDRASIRADELAKWWLPEGVKR